MGDPPPGLSPRGGVGWVGRFLGKKGEERKEKGKLGASQSSV